ncbi:RNA polymerase sigma factor SigJ [Paenibacillus pseudetheri]|uniref:ECF RNA polymerase sigma factor SigJ n=1 Tax=Paenibacillus pseudetheri TaxID=2897682 RepID=A0ABM9BCG6_9BACL|nr:RNA polymerase sigma factor SigJ [Paenibacillus pseudetheri]CAH1056407.1 ECF RNA polymerase sigma factor SigJ [Paenibacillus pseudetheri]
MDFQVAYTNYHSLLQAIAYRMTGSIADAEDLVQDVFIEYSKLQTIDITHPKAYLIRMITNRCINYMQSARIRREQYVGTWLPEPLVSFTNGGGDNPADLFDHDENVSYALLVMLEHLSAVERAVFILRQSFAFEYSEIADVLGKSEANCRKIFSRANDKLHQQSPVLPGNTAQATPLATAFLAAARGGNVDALVSLLTEDALLTSDGGGKVRAAIFTITGRDRVQAFIEGVITKGFLGDSQSMVLLNGQLGIVIYREGRPLKAISFQLDAAGERIEHIYIVLNPDKLQRIG